VYDLHGTEAHIIHKRFLPVICGALTGRARELCEQAQRGLVPGPGVPAPQPRIPFRPGPGRSPGGCIVPFRRDPVTGRCRLFLGDQPGPEPGGVGGGDAVLGRFGAAMTPDVESTTTLVCLPGMVLGKDELCYNKGKNGISNSQRKWPRGTRPLGTPGEMAALTKATAFGKRFVTTQKRLQKLGIIKKPVSRKAAPRPRQLTAGGESTRIINVD